MTAVPKAHGVVTPKSFTSKKLDWMNAVMGDPRLDARDFEVAFCIAQHVNAQSGRAMLSDDTISDKTAIPKRWIARSRASLRDTGWINWSRTRTANIYWTLGDQMNAVTDHQILLRDKRAERRAKLKFARQVTPPVAYLKLDDLPSAADLE